MAVSIAIDRNGRDATTHAYSNTRHPPRLILPASPLARAQMGILADGANQCRPEALLAVTALLLGEVPAPTRAPSSRHRVPRAAGWTLVTVARDSL